MAGTAGAPEPSQGPLYTPIIIAFCIIVSAATALAAIHFFLKQLFGYRSNSTYSNTNNYCKKALVGVDKKVLQSIPVYSYNKEIIGGGAGVRHDQECAVCLGEFEEGENVRLLPGCNHVFHSDCIDAWFERHATCPFCRTIVNSPFEVAVRIPEASVCPLQSQDGEQQQRTRLQSLLSWLRFD